jgi:hypothetical protein
MMTYMVVRCCAHIVLMSSSLRGYRRYDILLSCVNELMKRGVIQPLVELNSNGAQVGETMVRGSNGDPDQASLASADQMLYFAAFVAEGMSGRGLRKLPLKTQAMYLDYKGSTLQKYLWALIETIKVERSRISK